MNHHMQPSVYKRNCHICNIELIYGTLATYKKAVKKQTTCKKCKKTSNSISENKIKEILRLNDENIFDAQIARMIEISYNSVKNILEKNGRKSNLVQHTIDLISESEARCFKCKTIQSIKNFCLIHKGSLYECRTSICNSCRKNRNYNMLNSDLEKYLTYRYRSLKRTAKERNIELNFSKKNFIEQYTSQSGKCFYSDEEMICEIGNGKQNRNVLSVDRVDTNKGYIYGNVVFCTYRINSIKNDLSLEEIKKWIPDWYTRIITFIK
jgi:hypothetical protein